MMPVPVTVEQPFAPGPPGHFHQLAVALIVPLPILSMPTSPKNELKCAVIVEPATWALTMIFIPVGCVTSYTCVGTRSLH